MPCPFTGPKMFWAGPKFLFHTKNLFIYCGSHKHFASNKKMIAFSKIVFCASTKFFGLAKKPISLNANVNKFLVLHKKFGPAQNILGPVKAIL